MAELPDELWRQILQIGVNLRGLKYKDLCCISISSRQLHRLSGDNSLWSRLLSSDFSVSSSSSPKSASYLKNLYRSRWERDVHRKKMAHERVVRRKDSQIVEHYRRIKELEDRLVEENNKLKTTLKELSNLHKLREATVALFVWQPEVIRARQMQIVEQYSVSVESRSRALDMELKLCRQQITILQKTLIEEKQRLDLAEEELISLKYHPLKDRKFTGSSKRRWSEDVINSKVKQPHSS